MKTITIKKIQDILKCYDEEKGVFRSIFWDSDEISRIKSFIRIIYDLDQTNNVTTSTERALSSQELIDFYRLLIDIKLRENTRSSEAIMKLLDLFYPKCCDNHYKVYLFDGIFRTLDRFGFFSNPNHFINLLELIANNNFLDIFNFYFKCDFMLLVHDIPCNNAIDALYYYSSIAKDISLHRYYYEIVRAIWMLKQLNMLTIHNIDILKNICKPREKEIPYLSKIIDICSRTHESLLFVKWHYEKYMEVEKKIGLGIDCQLENLSLRLGKYSRSKWLVRLFEAYRLLIQSQFDPDIELSRFVDCFVSSRIQICEYFRANFFCDLRINIVTKYSNTLETLSNKHLLSPDLALVILNHSEPDLLLRLLIQLNKKGFSESELYCLRNFDCLDNEDRDLVPLFYMALERQEIIKNSRILFQAWSSDQDNLFEILPYEILIRIVQLTATNLDDKEASKLAAENFNTPVSLHG